jgi:hypothetical protein
MAELRIAPLPGHEDVQAGLVPTPRKYATVKATEITKWAQDRTNLQNGDDLYRMIYYAIEGAKNGSHTTGER